MMRLMHTVAPPKTKYRPLGHLFSGIQYIFTFILIAQQSLLSYIPLVNS